MDIIFLKSIFWLIYLICQSILGYFLVKGKTPQLIMWSFPIISVLFSHFLFLEFSALIRMLVLIIPLLHAMKIVVANIHIKGKLSFKNWLSYYFLTVNMNPSIFTTKSQRIIDFKLLGGALIHLFLGLIVIVYLRNFIVLSDISKSYVWFWLYSLQGLVALSLILHFGILPIQTFILKSWGFADYPVFRQPFKSKSITEFWGKRWNLAFSEMTATAMFKPLTRKVGVQWAGFLSFMLSGLLHEVAISLSVMQGFGLPMLYFVIHGILMQVEKKIFKKKKAGTIWVLASLILPMPILFHTAFLQEVIWALIYFGN